MKKPIQQYTISCCSPTHWAMSSGDAARHKPDTDALGQMAQHPPNLFRQTPEALIQKSF
ncbi:MAG: hypothetical protein IPK32_12235 [Verrucomicrobiaceae bacterium]|nr:hypothetical protein [Verrucomicrobiaceae bacterium]